MATPQGDYVAAIGRRKNATVRVRLYMRPGDYIVNDKPMADYFNSVINPEKLFMEPFRITNTLGKYAVTVKAVGSGVSAQLDATVMGIARALVKVDPELKKALRDAGFMTRDPRMKESRKPGRGGSARRKRQSPKR
jgi:small subunit ribosomal protein S9